MNAVEDASFFHCYRVTECVIIGMTPVVCFVVLRAGDYVIVQIWPVVLAIEELLGARSIASSIRVKLT